MFQPKRVRVRRPLCDDECERVPFWQHPLVVSVVTVAATALAEVWVRNRVPEAPHYHLVAGGSDEGGDEE